MAARNCECLAEPGALVEIELRVYAASKIAQRL